MSLVQSAVRGGLLRVDQPETPEAIRRRAWESLAGEIRNVALVGGMSNVPAVRRRIAALIPDATVGLAPNPQESVVRGLTRGDELINLNLPRPPVDIIVEYAPETVAATGITSNPVTVYAAYTPLYHPADLLRGHSNLGLRCQIPVPDGVKKHFKFAVRMVMPNQERTPLSLKVRDHHRNLVDEVDYISLEHDPRRPAPTLKVYTNGSIVVNTSTRSLKARVTRWPTLRGSAHDYQREVEIELPKETSPSKLRGDNWRFQ